MRRGASNKRKWRLRYFVVLGDGIDKGNITEKEIYPNEYSRTPSPRVSKSRKNKQGKNTPEEQTLKVVSINSETVCQEALSTTAVKNIYDILRGWGNGQRNIRDNSRKQPAHSSSMNPFLIFVDNT